MQQRRSPRKKVHHAGSILFTRECYHGPAQVRLPCHLVDISETGARISGAILHALPPVFMLEVKGLNLTMAVQLRWKLKHEIGVSFERPISFEALKVILTRNGLDESRQRLSRRI